MMRWTQALATRRPVHVRHISASTLSRRLYAVTAFTHPSPQLASESASSSDASILTRLDRFRALVLDSSYRPVDVINWQRAIVLDLFDKVDVLEYYEDYVKSAHAQFMLPAVLRVRMYVQANRNTGRLTLSRRNIMLRDRFTCQYCGTQSNLTIDHVVPLASKGKWQWDNLVTACTRCNGRKGDKSLKQLNWRLKRQPWEPSPYELGMLFGTDAISVTQPPKEWSDYLFISKGDKFTSARPVLDNVDLDAA